MGRLGPFFLLPGGRIVGDALLGLCGVVQGVRSLLSVQPPPFGHV